MFDPDAVSASLVAGAHVVGNIVSTEVVKEMTKDAYKGLKGKIVEIWGRGGERAVARVEADPTSPDALENLRATIAVVPTEDEEAVLEKHRNLLSALGSDDVARGALEQVATIRLVIESEGSVRIGSLRNARVVDVTSRSVGGFDLANIDMDPGAARGN